MIAPSRPQVLCRVAAVVLLALGSTACTNASSPGDAETAESTALQTQVAELAARAGVSLAPDDARCVAGELDLALATRIVEQRSKSLPLDDATEVSGAVLDCVGEETIGRAALVPQAGGVRETSLDCAAQRLEREFILDLVASGIAGVEQAGPDVELQIVTAFGLCLEADELLEG